MGKEERNGKHSKFVVAVAVVAVVLVGREGERERPIFRLFLEGLLPPPPAFSRPPQDLKLPFGGSFVPSAIPLLKVNTIRQASGWDLESL